MKAYIDSDILIRHLRGDLHALHFLRKLQDDGRYDLWIGAMQRAEVVFFMRPGEEDSTELFLSQFKTSAVDQPIIDIAGALYRKWNPSHGIDVNDAILAATTIQTGGRIYCLNIKHYPMPDILVEKAW
ncbi:MAG: PIN domain-containing protein [Thermodesulfobacteriota bacterium]|nr:PIN domain-containing protein [Thermodesulfobacteriota bacterium]